jgi:NAD(P)-dependent dehydrogenase (short-subunit alcohol dehydrogenase family)
MTLQGQVALITGAGSGIGAAIARALSAEGAAIVLCGRRAEALAAIAQTLDGAHMCVPCDVRDEAQVQSAVEDAAEKLGRLDILVNNAGIFSQAPIEETTPEFWDDMLATNLRGPFLFARSAWPHLKQSRGQILNLSSVAGTQGFAGSSAYCASKFGLNGLSAVLAVEGKEHGIRVHSVCPASIETDMWLNSADDATRNRMMKPDQVADLVRWLLCSPRNLDIPQVVVTNFQSPFE